MEALERLKIYEQMLLDFSSADPIERDRTDSESGMCFYLSFKGKYRYEELDSLFPEIFNQALLENHLHGYWFPTMFDEDEVGPDYPRMEVIEKAIEQVKTLL
jgi:hypothetical protein